MLRPSGLSGGRTGWRGGVCEIDLKAWLGGACCWKPRGGLSCGGMKGAWTGWRPRRRTADTTVNVLARWPWDGYRQSALVFALFFSFHIFFFCGALPPCLRAAFPGGVAGIQHIRTSGPGGVRVGFSPVTAPPSPPRPAQPHSLASRLVSRPLSPVCSCVLFFVFSFLFRSLTRYNAPCRRARQWPAGVRCAAAVAARRK